MSEPFGFHTDPLVNLRDWAARIRLIKSGAGLDESLTEYAEAWQKEREAMKAIEGRFEPCIRTHGADRPGETGISFASMEPHKKGTWVSISYVNKLKARVAELEAEGKQKGAIIEHSEARIASLIRLIDASEVAIQERAARISELQIALETALAEVERLRVIELPEIDNHPQARKMWNLGLATLGGKGYEWSKEARALVALLNEERKV